MSGRACKLRRADNELSPLQVTMLKMAAANRRAGRTSAGRRDVDLYFAEVLVNVLGWPVPPDMDRSNELRDRAETLHWSVRRIGRKRYMTDIERIAKATFDMHARGMLVAWQGERPLWTELTLTDSGRAIADKLIT
jgi:hypothetical protein